MSTMRVVRGVGKEKKRATIDPRIYLFVLLVCLSLNSTVAGASDVVDQALGAKSIITNYSVEFKEIVREKSMICDESGVQRRSSEFLNFERSGAVVRDGRKRAQRVYTPVVKKGGMVLGQPEEFLTAYDGTQTIAKVKGNAYLVGSKVPIAERCTSPMSFIEDNFTMLSLKKAQSARNEVTVVETQEGDVYRVDFSSANGCKMSFVIDAAKAYSITALRLYDAEGNLYEEREAVSYEEYSLGLWVPTRIEYRLFSKEDGLVRDNALILEKGRFNQPNVDPASFSIDIPGGAFVTNVDLGISYTEPDTNLEELAGTE